MTGKELIIYILENNLENEEVVKDNSLLFMMNVGEAAAKFDVGIATVRAWIAEGRIPWFVIGGEIYIYRNAKDPRK